MSDDRRNPYLVLGVPHGATRDEATAAFAARSRRARREPDFPYSIDDLTWALHQVEERIENPASDLDTFRVPADQFVLRPPAGDGVLRLRPTPMPRRTGPATTAMLEDLHDRAVRDAVASALEAESPDVVERSGFARPVTGVKVSLVEPPAQGSPKKRSTAPPGSPVRRPWWAGIWSLGSRLSAIVLVLVLVGVLAVVASHRAPEGTVLNSDTTPIATSPPAGATQNVLPSDAVTGASSEPGSTTPALIVVPSSAGVGQSSVSATDSQFSTLSVFQPTTLAPGSTTPAGPTTTVVTATTAAPTTTVVPIEIVSESFSPSSINLPGQTNVYVSVTLRDPAGRLPDIAGARLCPEGSTNPNTLYCTGANMSRSGTAFEASYLGLCVVNTSAPTGAWFAYYFWPVGQISEFELRGTATVQVTRI